MEYKICLLIWITKCKYYLINSCICSVPAHFRMRTLNQSGVAGESVVLTCEAEGDLPLRVVWGAAPRLHTPPPHSRPTPSGLASEIHLPALSRRDAGPYHCTAHNEFGEDHMVIYLTVRGKNSCIYSLLVHKHYLPLSGFVKAYMLNERIMKITT